MARHNRAYLREQRNRIISKRIKRAHRELAYREWVDSIPEGRMFRHTYPLYGCGRARCGICHSGKLYDARRAREKRAWLRLLELDAL